jgi:hypothetical protein
MNFCLDLQINEPSAPRVAGGPAVRGSEKFNGAALLIPCALLAAFFFPTNENARRTLKRDWRFRKAEYCS